MKWLLGIILSLSFLYLSLKGIHWDSLLQNIKVIDGWQIVIMLIFIALFFLLKTIRHKLLLSTVGSFSLKDLFPSIVIGTAANYVLFGYLGEFVRTFIFCKKQPVDPSFFFSTIILERLFDLWMLLAFFTLATYFAPGDLPFAMTSAYIATGLIFLISIVLYFSIRFTSFLPNFFKEKREMILKELKALFKLKEMKYVILLTFLMWIAMCGCNYFAARSIGLSVSPLAFYYPMMLTVFALLLPSSPGQIGVIEFCMVLGLKAWNVDQTDAFLAGAIFHLVLYFSVILTAFILMYKLGLTWKKLKY